MQVTKKSKYTFLFSIIILINFTVYAQETGENNSNTDTLINQTDSLNTKHKFFFSNLFKFKKKKSDEDEELNDTTAKKKFPFKNLFKHKNKQDSITIGSDSLATDSLNQKDKFKLFNKNKNDSSESKGTEKPQRITLGVWLKLNAAEQDSLLRAWDNYDREFYVKKYQPTEKERQRDMKEHKNFIDKFLLKIAVNKPYKYRKKLINRRISRYKKTMKFDQLKKSRTAPNDTITDIKRYQTVNKQFKREAKQEAIRKNKVILKYDKKEERLKKQYTLSDNEKQLLHKGTAMRLKGIDRIIFNKAKRKQEKFSENLLKLRRKRSIALQNTDTRKKMKEDQKRIVERDQKLYKKQNKKKRNRDKNKKHDSSEYPKRYFNE